jgi:hypothetical protein
MAITTQERSVEPESGLYAFRPKLILDAGPDLCTHGQHLYIKIFRVEQYTSDKLCCLCKCGSLSAVQTPELI